MTKLARMTKSRTRLVGVVIMIGIVVFTARYASQQGSLYGYSPFSYNDDSAFVENQLGSPDHPRVGHPKVGDSYLGPVHSFWNNVFTIFENNELNVTSNDLPNAIQYVEKSQQKGGKNTKETLLSKAFIADDTLQELTKKHKKVIEMLPSALSESAYRKGTTGVVLVGGTRFSWLAYLSLLALRDTGSKLPVEIMMPTFRDYERELDFCTKVLPPLDASCVVVPDVLGPSVMLHWAKKFANYQFKILALMTSSFQNVLMLDSDNILVDSPDAIFESKLFEQNGLITWPDYWERTISPAFYDVAGLQVNERKRVRYNRFPLNVPLTESENLNDQEAESVPFHDLDGTIPNLSTESGQLVVNKATHGKTLLLALYYNIYGPNLFYKLLSLGEQGEGDKDTFCAAAIVAKQKYYQVKSYIRTFGYFDSSEKFQGVAMGQKNPLHDFELFEKEVNGPSYNAKPLPLNEQVENLQKISKEHFDNNNGVPLWTIHCNYPKLDPLDYMNREEIYDKEKKKLRYRLYNGLTYEKSHDVAGSITKLEIDFELEQWKNMQKVLCKDKTYFVHFEKIDRSDLCTFVKNQVDWLSEKKEG